MRLKKYWQVFLAILLFAEPLWRFTKWVLDWRGRIDVVAETYHEIGGIDAIVGFILDPPPWLDPIIILVGLALIWYSLRQQVDESQKAGRPKLETWGPWVLIIGGPALGMLWLYWNHIHPTFGQPGATETPKNIAAQPLKLEHFFATDFGFLSIDRVLSMRIEMPASDVDTNVEIKIRIFRDFSSNTEFVSIFVPFLTDARLAHAGEQLIENLATFTLTNQGPTCREAMTG